MIVNAGILPFSLSCVMVAELPPLKKSQLQKRMKQPPTTKVNEEG